MNAEFALVLVRLQRISWDLPLILAMTLINLPVADPVFCVAGHEGEDQCGSMPIKGDQGFIPSLVKVGAFEDKIRTKGCKIGKQTLNEFLEGRILNRAVRGPHEDYFGPLGFSGDVEALPDQFPSLLRLRITGRSNIGDQGITDQGKY
jgi:hypothetical protein